MRYFDMRYFVLWNMMATETEFVTHGAGLKSNWLPQGLTYTHVDHDAIISIFAVCVPAGQAFPRIPSINSLSSKPTPHMLVF